MSSEIEARDAPADHDEDHAGLAETIVTAAGVAITLLFVSSVAVLMVLA